MDTAQGSKEDQVAVGGEVFQLLKTLRQKGVGAQRLDKLLKSGILPDILEVDPDRVSRDDIAFVAGVFPFSPEPGFGEAQVLNDAIQDIVDSIAPAGSISVREYFEKMCRRDQQFSERECGRIGTHHGLCSGGWDKVLRAPLFMGPGVKLGYQFLTPRRRMTLEVATRFLERDGFRHADVRELLAVLDHCYLTKQLARYPYGYAFAAYGKSDGEEAPVSRTSIQTNREAVVSIFLRRIEVESGNCFLVCREVAN